jgi:hypothetical protein
MRLLGWPEETCTAAASYVDVVRYTYTGRAWYSYTMDVDRFLREREIRNMNHFLSFFPRRSGVGVTLANFVEGPTP